MKSYRVHNFGSQLDYNIDGDNLLDAIERNFALIGRRARLGNAAGWRLKSARAEYKGSIIGGKGGVELEITHCGMQLAHREADKESKVASVWIHATPDDLPEPHDFELRPTSIEKAVRDCQRVERDETSGQEWVLVPATIGGKGVDLMFHAGNDGVSLSVDHSMLNLPVGEWPAALYVDIAGVALRLDRGDQEFAQGDLASCAYSADGLQLRVFNT